MLIGLLDVVLAVMVYGYVKLSVSDGSFFGYGQIIALSRVMFGWLPGILTGSNLLFVLLRMGSWEWVVVPYGLIGLWWIIDNIGNQIVGKQYKTVLYRVNPIVSEVMQQYGREQKISRVYVTHVKKHHHGYQADSIRIYVEEALPENRNEGPWPPYWKHYYPEYETIREEVKRTIKQQFLELTFKYVLLNVKMS
jgi:hypothetical protein